MTLPLVLTVILGVVIVSGPTLPPLLELRLTEVVPVIVPLPPMPLPVLIDTVGAERFAFRVALAVEPEVAIRLADVVAVIGLLSTIAPAAFAVSVRLTVLPEEAAFMVTACESVIVALPVVLKVSAGVLNANGP